jgi:hypothetical protein
MMVERSEVEILRRRKTCFTVFCYSTQYNPICRLKSTKLKFARCFIEYKCGSLL